jgi:hypothetical protein
MKEDLNKDRENLIKKKQTETLELKNPFNQIKNTLEAHSSRIEQEEHRISGLKDEIVIKENTQELLNKRLKSYERNM